MTIERYFTIDGEIVHFEAGQTILQAALAAGVFIPHLCFIPISARTPRRKLCTVTVDGRNASACATPAMPGHEVHSDTPELNARRRVLLQMLFVEGNHFCPGCAKSGNCKLQALGYELEMFNAHFTHFYPDRGLNWSHPDIILDRNRCIMCETCVRASRDVDGKSVFALAGRGARLASRDQFAIGQTRRYAAGAVRQSGACLPGRRAHAQARGLFRADWRASVRP